MDDISPTAAAASGMIRAGGLRSTAARLAVLETLLAAERALTHHEIAARLDCRPPVNRVTLYRVLEWLVRHQLAHKIADEDRVWRFNASPPAESDRDRHRHAHFRCRRCGGVTCLESIPTIFALSLPAGFQSQEVELTIRGLCAACNATGLHTPHHLGFAP